MPITLAITSFQALKQRMFQSMLTAKDELELEQHEIDEGYSEYSRWATYYNFLWPQFLYERGGFVFAYIDRQRDRRFKEAFTAYETLFNSEDDDTFRAHVLQTLRRRRGRVWALALAGGPGIELHALLCFLSRVVSSGQFPQVQGIQVRFDGTVVDRSPVWRPFAEAAGWAFEESNFTHVANPDSEVAERAAIADFVLMSHVLVDFPASHAFFDDLLNHMMPQSSMLVIIDRFEPRCMSNLPSDNHRMRLKVDVPDTRQGVAVAVPPGGISPEPHAAGDEGIINQMLAALNVAAA